ncbi:DUF4190 domain-containing protein [Luteolibacter pohnpeiensis]|uniref:DUF4190 domain-containing protein n=1 Tax=Luteolibacter pohnpeiensis TaxID=454153 RepID=A0A934S3I2_9BACT|nr:DUF4190 domain-containing protein [Luteolibacter pohnpeiensis]
MFQEELIVKIASGEVSAQDLVWCEGMPDWKPAGQVEIFKTASTNPLNPARPPVIGEPSPYAPPAFPMPASGPLQVTSSKATASMVLGIVSLVLSICGCYSILISLPCAILAVVFGNQAKKQIMARPELMHDLGKAKSGVIMGWIAIGVTVLMMLITTATFAWTSTRSSSSSSSRIIRTSHF